MKKNELLQSIKIIILGLVVSLGVSSVFSAGSSVKPINVGTSPQVKDGKLSVNSFLATNNTLLNGGVRLNNLANTNAIENRLICADNNGIIVVCNP